MFADRDLVAIPHKGRTDRGQNFTEDDQCSSLLIFVGKYSPDESLEDDVQHHRQGSEQGGFGDAQPEEEPQIYREITVEQTPPEHRQDLER